MLRRLLPVAFLFAAATAQAETNLQLDAKSHYLVDAVSGAVLAESGADTQLDPASLTKLMTAYLAFDAVVEGHASLTDPVPVSEKAWRAPGSRMFIEVGSEVVLDDLLRGLIVQSGNDAAIALAEYLAGSEADFAEAMNRTAADLGMSGTTYRNSNGLPAAGHLSTARDTAILARALIDRFPAFYSRYSEREFTYNEIRQHNRNALLWLDESVDGLKTGYTRAAGYCLVSSAERDGMRLIAVVFGASTADARTESSMALLDYGFDAFETHKLFSGGQAIAEARVFRGRLDRLPLGPAGDVYVTVPRGEYANLAASAALTTDIVAPLARDEVVGDLMISLGGEPVSRMPLVALETVDEGWVLKRLTGSVALWFD
ncbi:MAG TPA: D-alanyl-D-alanine carboxypeptidase family protein [Gammaproteobacteria bacterium]|nr:D-alanyl-D-alanine carboxypeptidase family protein [Gammaproteobacteria bacterium]